jgi:hypothetical protein
MNAGRKHINSWVRNKGQLITHNLNTIQRISISVLVLRATEDQMISAHTMGYISGKFKTLECFIIGSKHTYILLQRILSVF